MTTSNKESQHSEEADEGRPMTKGNLGQDPGSQAQNWVVPFVGLDRIRQAVRKDRRQRAGQAAVGPA